MHRSNRQRLPSTCFPATTRRAGSWLGIASLVLVFFGCSASEEQPDAAGRAGETKPRAPMYQITEADTAGLSQATFAGGCFWCLETAFEGVPGVHAAISGYAGGREADPTYEEVSSGTTGHAESVLVTYDPETISYEQLLEIFWTNHDPLVANGQFCDHGRQYRPAIFYLDPEQKRQAEASVAWAREHLKTGGSIVTEITGVTEFWPAEEYHQDFWKKDPDRYYSYRRGCGRDARLKELWGESATGH